MSSSGIRFQQTSALSPPAIISYKISQPLHPLDNVRLDEVLAVVHVWGGRKKLSRRGATSASKVPVITHNGPRVPIHTAPKSIPDTLLILQVKALLALVGLVLCQSLS